LGYDTEQVILIINNPDNKITCESRFPNLSFKQLIKDSNDNCLNYLNQDTYKHFPLYSFQCTQKEYSEFLENYSVITDNERKIQLWKYAYSHVFDFLAYISKKNIELTQDFHQVYLEVFSKEIKNDVNFQNKKLIHTRLINIYERIVTTLNQKNNL
jgi:hypothetical protein